jgi:hypothetical protein
MVEHDRLRNTGPVIVRRHLPSRLVAIAAACCSLVTVAACGDADEEPVADPCATTVPANADTTSTTTTTTVAGAETSIATTTTDPCPPDGDEPSAEPAPTSPSVEQTAAGAPSSAVAATTTAASVVDTTTSTTVPEADPRGRRFSYDGTIGVFPMGGEFCVPEAAPITIESEPGATFNPSEMTDDPTAPDQEVPFEAEVTFELELPTAGSMSYFIAAGGATFQGEGTVEIEWSTIGGLSGVMTLRDSVGTATAAGFEVDDTNEVAGLFDVREVGTC